jgi:hypothetical protein
MTSTTHRCEWPLRSPVVAVLLSLRMSWLRAGWEVPLPLAAGSGAWSDEAGLVGGDDGLCSVAYVEFAQDVADVCFDGQVAEDEAVGDLCV